MYFACKQVQRHERVLRKATQGTEKMKIKSTYRAKNEQFTMTVLNEDENSYTVMFDEPFRAKFKDGYKPHKIEKRLIGSLYEIIEEYQMSMFD